VVTDIDLTGRAEKYVGSIHPGPVHVSLHEHNYPILSGDIIVAPTIRPMKTGPGGKVGVTHFNGREYILLPREIGDLRANAGEFRSDPLDGVITLGGGDPSGLTHNVLSALRALNYPKIKWKVVLGPASSYSVPEMMIAYPEFREFINGAKLGRKDFLQLLASSDVIVTNGGTTLYESLALGKPCLAIPQNEFEADVVRRLSDMHACTGTSDATRTGILVRLEEFLDSADERMKTAERAGGIIDGEGCKRVAELILGRISS
jgi:spore coat polysaccharide biosynthesis predicted glycosyltransferase SpsG